MKGKIDAMAYWMESGEYGPVPIIQAHSTSFSLWFVSEPLGVLPNAESTFNSHEVRFSGETPTHNQ